MRLEIIELMFGAVSGFSVREIVGYTQTFQLRTSNFSFQKISGARSNLMS